MIKAKADGMLFFGLTDKNIEALKKGNPVHIFGAEMGIEWDIVIMWGETEEDIVKSLKPMMDDRTQVNESKGKH